MGSKPMIQYAVRYRGLNFSPESQLLDFVHLLLPVPRPREAALPGLENVTVGEPFGRFGKRPELLIRIIDAMRSV
jgi:hypothetical protein